MRNDVFINRARVPIIRDGDPALQAAIINKPNDYGRIFVMINNQSYGHAGLVIDEGEDALLYDPSGTYDGRDDRGAIQSFRGSGDFFEYPEFDWDSYLSLHLNDGIDIVVFEFILPRSQVNRMKDIVLYESEIAGFFACAKNVARVLLTSGGIFKDQGIKENTFYTPWGLKAILLNIQFKKGIVQHVFITTPPYTRIQ